MNWAHDALISNSFVTQHGTKSATFSLIIISDAACSLHRILSIEAELKILMLEKDFSDNLEISSVEEYEPMEEEFELQGSSSYSMCCKAPLGLFSLFYNNTWIIHFLYGIS